MGKFMLWDHLWHAVVVTLVCDSSHKFHSSLVCKPYSKCSQCSVVKRTIVSASEWFAKSIVTCRFCVDPLVSVFRNNEMHACAFAGNK